jgi:4-hydroxybenzoate polyprenyltransferase
MGSGGTLALNSAFDKDEGDIAFLHNPPKPPRLLALFALVVMVVGLVVALFISVRFLVAYLICFLMSTLYSVPPFRMKSRPGADMLISATGYGAMTIYSGWAAMDLPLAPPITNVVVAFFCLLVAWYPLTQFYQVEEDRRRGDRTLTLTIGKRNGLILATVAALAGFAFLGAEILLRHWGLRAIGVALGFLFWGAVIVHWWFHWREADTLYERTGMYRLVWAFALTQVGVLLAMLPLSPSQSNISLTASSMAVGLTLYRPAYLGAEPCVGSKMAKSSPMLPLEAKPSPPTNCAARSDTMSPNMLLDTNTP